MALSSFHSKLPILSLIPNLFALASIYPSLCLSTHSLWVPIHSSFHPPTPPATICLTTRYPLSALTGRFPDYPDEASGGSYLIFADKTPEQVLLRCGQAPPGIADSECELRICQRRRRGSLNRDSCGGDGGEMSGKETAWGPKATKALRREGEVWCDH